MPDVNQVPPATNAAGDLAAAAIFASTRNLQAFAAEMNEMSRQSVEHASETIEKLRGARGLTEVLAIQSGYVREALEHAMRHTRRLGELMASVPLEMSKSCGEAWSKSMKTAMKTTEEASEKAVANAERLAQPFRDS